ncbi:MAG TPA: hypothetical protein VFB16_15035 [Bauldia sp.]|nr:hypothetical protein [Bauldia sp.]
MRMANDRDQAIVRSAVPDAGSSQIDFLASLGTREAIAFGEGVALPMRFRFSDVPKEFQPRSQAGRNVRLEMGSELDGSFMEGVVERWREATTTSTRPRGGLSGMEDAMDMEAGFGAPLIPRRA